MNVVSTTCLGMTVSIGVLLAAPARADLLDDLVHGAIAFHDDHSVAPLADLSASQLQRLRDGDVVSLRRRSRDSQGQLRDTSFAYALTRAPRLDVWLAATRPGLAEDGDLRITELERDDVGGTLGYFRFHLPWPMQDRQWIARRWMDLDIAAASGGRVWARRFAKLEHSRERALELVESRTLTSVTSEDVEQALELPVYEGSLVVFDLDGEHTLVVIRCAIDPGGMLPDTWTAKLGERYLEGTVEAIVRTAPTARDEYARDDSARFDGEGRVISSGGSELVQATEPPTSDATVVDDPR